MVLLAGDLVIQGVLGGAFVSPEESAEILKDLTAPLGVSPYSAIMTGGWTQIVFGTRWRGLTFWCWKTGPLN